MGSRPVAALSLLLPLLIWAPVAGGASRSGGHGKKHRVAPPAIALEHLSTHETFLLRPDDSGRLQPKRLRGLRRFLRCHHTGRQHAIAPRLAQLLYATAHQFGDRRVTVIAGYRAPRVAREKGNPRSPHKRGVACDFRIDGVDNAVLRDYLRHAYSKVGVGYYPNAGFVHLDVGRRQSAFWIDYSGPGERARYSSDPSADLENGLDGAPAETVSAPAGDGEAEEFDDPGLISGPTAER